MITSVILWTNGMVACFDENGQQMPAYQGHYYEVKPKILNEYQGLWQLGEWNRGILAEFNPRVYLPFDGKNTIRWEYFEIPAEACPRITPEFLAEEKETMGEWWFEQEYH